MLSVTADSHKQPLYVIFEHKSWPRENFPKGTFVQIQVKEWMTEELILDWIQKVLFQQSGSLVKLNAMLVMDAYERHTTDVFNDHKTDLPIIPGIMTSQLQLLYICANKPFKDIT